MNESWLNLLKEELKKKRCKIYLIVSLIIVGALIGEFIWFEYSILKCIRYCILVIGLFAIAYVDKQKKIIPNKLLLMLLGIRLILLIIEWISYPELGLSIIISSALGALIGGGAFLICYLVSRGGMGAGDVKLYAVVGLYLGNGVIMPNMIISVFISAVYSIILLVQKKTNMKEEIPFGPFILVGTVITMALGM